MKKIIIPLFIIIIISINIRGQQNWISIDYVEKMKNLLPCECEDSLLPYFYIEIDTVWSIDSIDKSNFKIVLYSPSKAEPDVFELQSTGNGYKPVIRYSDIESFEQLFIKNDTLYLETKESQGKYIRLNHVSEKLQLYAPYGAVLLNTALELRGYLPIKDILKVDKTYNKISFDCEAWWWRKNRLTIFSTKEKVSPNPINYILYIKDGYLYIEKVLSDPIDDPFGDIKTKFIRKLRWKTLMVPVEADL